MVGERQYGSQYTADKYYRLRLAVLSAYLK